MQQSYRLQIPESYVDMNALSRKGSALNMNREKTAGAYEGFQCKARYINFVKFSGQAAQTVAFMEFCIEAQTLKGILTAMYFILTCEILPAGAGQGEEDFSAEKCI